MSARLFRFLLVAAIVASANGLASAQLRRMRGPGAAQPAPGDGAPVTNWPVTMADAKGNQWRFYYGGILQGDENNTFDQGNQLMFNGNGLNNNGGASLSSDGTELVIALNELPNGVRCTRRISVNRDMAYVRVLEVFENSTRAPVTMSITVYHNLGNSLATLGGNASTYDPAKRELEVAVLEQPQGSNRSTVGLVLAGPASPVTVQLAANQGSDDIRENYNNFTVPAGGRAVIMHTISKLPTGSTDKDVLAVVNERDLLKSLPPDLRKDLVNWRSHIWSLDGMEVPRGELNDVVELHSGNQLQGLLEPQKLVLKTSLGDVPVPDGKIAALLPTSNGQLRVVLQNGEVLVGTTTAETIAIKLNSGQVLQLPIAKIKSVGTNTVGQDSEAWENTSGFIRLRDGQRLKGALPAGNLGFMTRLGTLQIPAAQIARLECGPQNSVHKIKLANGSTLLGILMAENVPVKFATLGDKTVARDWISLATGAAPSTQPVEPPFSVTTVAGEQLLGDLTPKKLNMRTEFGRLDVDLAQCKQIEVQADGSVGTATVMLWDGSRTTGQIEQDALAIEVAPGLSIKLPIAGISSLTNSQPELPPAMAERVVKLIVQLNDSDFKSREEAQTRLIELGDAILPILKKELKTAKFEARSRIEQIIERLAPAPDKAPPGAQPPQPEEGMPAPALAPQLIID